jgi:hypothetical protein
MRPHATCNGFWTVFPGLKSVPSQRTPRRSPFRGARSSAGHSHAAVPLVLTDRVESKREPRHDLTLWFHRSSSTALQNTRADVAQLLYATGPALN